jgi:hypothetical protein
LTSPPSEPKASPPSRPASSGSSLTPNAFASEDCVQPPAPDFLP